MNNFKLGDTVNFIHRIDASLHPDRPRLLFTLRQGVIIGIDNGICVVRSRGVFWNTEYIVKLENLHPIQEVGKYDAPLHKDFEAIGEKYKNGVI